MRIRIIAGTVNADKETVKKFTLWIEHEETYTKSVQKNLTHDLLKVRLSTLRFSWKVRWKAWIDGKHHHFWWNLDIPIQCWNWVSIHALNFFFLRTTSPSSKKKSKVDVLSYNLKNVRKLRTLASFSDYRQVWLAPGTVPLSFLIMLPVARINYSIFHRCTLIDFESWCGPAVVITAVCSWKRRKMEP